MKKSFTHKLQKIMLALFLSVLSFGAMAQDLKPYPVYFPLADYWEFNYGVNKNITRPNMTNMFWHSLASWTATANCTTVNFLTTPSNSVIAAPYGRAVSLNIGVNRAVYIDMMTPYLNPGTYRVYLGTSFSSGTTRAFSMWNVKMDSVLITAPADTSLRWFNGTTTATAPNKQSLRFTGTGTNRHYDIYCGQVTIETAGRHKFHFDPGGGTGTDYAFTMLQFIPVTETNLDTEYDYPKFDMGGTVFMTAADSNVAVVNTATTGYYLPYQATDPTVYSKFNVTLDAGLYFESKQVVVKRADDKWTRLFAGTADATGKCVTTLPAGSYYVEVNKGQHTTTIEVGGSGTQNVGVETANINVTFNPELWYIGKKFQVYNSTGTILLKEVDIPANGILPMFALPVDAVNNYIYYVINTDVNATKFETGTVSVPTSTTVNLDLTATKFNVNINLSNDSYGANQPFTIVRSNNSNALYVAGTSNASGTYSVQLPNGTYYLSTNSGLILKTFTVNGATVTLNLTARYTANFCFGKAMAGVKVDVYLSSTAAKLYSLTLNSDGEVSCPGMTNGRFYHNAYKASGVDTTWFTRKFTFVIEGANFDLGNCGNANLSYSLPYPVYFDMCNQPEITWMTAKTFQPGDLQYIKFDKVAIDTGFIENDPTVYPDSIKYWDYNCHYNFNGITYTKIEDCYVWGDVLYFRFPAKGRITFVTPNLNPGRYNVYISNRWAPGRTGSGFIDTTYMDGKTLLTTDGIKRTFSGNADDYANGMNSLLRIMSYATGTGTQAQGALFMGEALVTTPGRHDLTLYSVNGASGSTTFDYQGGWWNMIYFIPVDVDAVTANTTYYPRIDICGNIVPTSTSTGQTTLGSDGVNRAKYMGQFTDPTVLKSDLVNYSKNLTINGGIYSRGDKLTTISPVDDWTIKQASADTITGIATLPLLPNSNPFKWSMDVEGVDGSVTVNADKTITIPFEINTAVTSTYGSIPSEEDPGFGTILLNSKVAVSDNLDFYYPITGVILYDLEGQLLSEGGDTIFKAKDKANNGIAPTLSFPNVVLSPDYLFITTYTGSVTRLKSATSVASYTNVKDIKLSAGIYPNPARESINLKLRDNNGLAIYTIYNQLGQAVLKGSFTGTQTNISLGGIRKGLYLVKVNACDKDMTTKLVIE